MIYVRMSHLNFSLFCTARENTKFLSPDPREFLIKFKSAFQTLLEILPGACLNAEENQIRHCNKTSSSNVVLKGVPDRKGLCRGRKSSNTYSAKKGRVPFRRKSSTLHNLFYLAMYFQEEAKAKGSYGNSEHISTL